MEVLCIHFYSLFHFAAHLFLFLLPQLLLEMDLTQHIGPCSPPPVRKGGYPIMELPSSDVPFAPYTAATLPGFPPGGWEGSKHEKT